MQKRAAHEEARAAASQFNVIFVMMLSYQYINIFNPLFHFNTCFILAGLQLQSHIVSFR